MMTLLRRIFWGIIDLPYYLYFFIRGHFMMRLMKKNPQKFQKKWSFEKKYNMAKKFCRKLLRFYNLKARYENFELAKDFKSGIVVVNHSTMLEPLIVTVALGWKIIWITKKENNENPFLRIISNLSNSLFIDRENSKTASLVLLQANRLVKKGHIIGICPEGTRSKSKKIIPFKKGIFDFIKLIKSDLLVIGISNCYRANERKKDKDDVLKCSVLKFFSANEIIKNDAETTKTTVKKMMENYLKKENKN